MTKDTNTGVVFKDTAAIVKTTLSILNQPGSFGAERNVLSYCVKLFHNVVHKKITVRRCVGLSEKHKDGDGARLMRDLQKCEKQQDEASSYFTSSLPTMLGVDPTSLTRFVTAASYQVLARLGNSGDVHRLPVDGVDESSLGHSDGTDDVDPAGCGMRR